MKKKTSHSQLHPSKNNKELLHAQNSNNIDEILKITEDIIRTEPLDTYAMGLRSVALLKSGKLKEASDLCKNVLILNPEDEQNWENYILSCLKQGRLHDALCAADRFCKLHHSARSVDLISGIYGLLGLEEKSKKYALHSAQITPFYTVKSKSNEKLNLIVFQSKASGSFKTNPQTGECFINEGHNNLTATLDREKISITYINVDSFNESSWQTKNLPKGNLIYNSITDADRCKNALEKAQKIYKKLKLPIINEPSLVINTSRECNYRRFKSNTKVIAPKAISLGICKGPLGNKIRSAAKDHNLKAPIIMRAGGYQGGKHMHKIDDLENLEVTLQKPAEIYLIQYHDISYSDKRAPEKRFYPKYRAMLVGETLFPVHCFIANDFNVHKTNADKALEEHPFLAEVEYEFLSDPEKHLGKKIWNNLKEAIKEIGLEYNGVDFALTECEENQKKVVIFESNPAMRNWIELLPEDNLVQQAWKKITIEAHYLLCQKSGIEPWDFTLPLGKPSTNNDNKIRVQLLSKIRSEKNSCWSETLFRATSFLSINSLIAFDSSLIKKNKHKWLIVFFEEFIKKASKSNINRIANTKLYTTKGYSAPETLVDMERYFKEFWTKEKVNLLNFEDASPFAWKTLALLAQEYELFSAAYFFRENYKKHLDCYWKDHNQNNNEIQPWLAKELLNYFAEEGLEHSFDQLTKNYYQANLPSFCLPFACYFPHNPFIKKLLEKVNKSQRSQKLHKIINRKRVAIIGPLNPSNEAINEIGNFDAIILFNYTQKPDWINKKDHKFKILSNYNRDDSQFIGSLSSHDFLDDLDLILTLEIERQRNPWFEKYPDKLHTIFNSYTLEGRPFISGVPNGIQRVLIEVASHSPAYIKIFNSNLFISDDYEENYMKRRGENHKSTYFEWSSHDIISCFSLLKRAHSEGLIDVDNLLKPVLEMDAKNYAHEMNRRFL